MVDTINPNTNQPDVIDEGKEPIQPTAQDDRFFGGFDKPDEVKINLADNQTPTLEPNVQEPTAPKQPVADVAPVKPVEVAHTSYVNTSDMINWRGVLVIVAIGLASTLLVGGGLYFGVTSLNNSKLKDQQAQLDTIKSDLAALNQTPDPLELPVEETTPEEEAPVVVPVETPVETPVVIPSTPVVPGGNG